MNTSAPPAYPIAAVLDAEFQKVIVDVIFSPINPVYDVGEIDTVGIGVKLIYN
jgi:hypothetical protein